MRNRKRFLLGLGLAAAISSASIMAQKKPTQTLPDMNLIMPVFTQLVRFKLPSGFRPIYEKTTGDGYVFEAVPYGETTDNWSQIITLTGYQNLANQPDVTPESLLGYLADKYEKSCPDSFAAQVIDPFPVDGYPTFAAILSCGRAEPVPDSPSESVVILSIKGAQDFYTLQWAERAPGRSTPLALDAAMWRQRLARLQPAHLCARIPGEAEPYPSCAQPPQSSTPASGGVDALPRSDTPAPNSGRDRDVAAAHAKVILRYIGAMSDRCSKSPAERAALIDGWRAQSDNDPLLRTAIGHDLDRFAKLEKAQGSAAARRETDATMTMVQQVTEQLIQDNFGANKQDVARTCANFDAAMAKGAFNLTTAAAVHRTLVQMSRETATEKP